MNTERRLLSTIRFCLVAISFILLFLLMMLLPLINPSLIHFTKEAAPSELPATAQPSPAYTWTPPDSSSIAASPEGDLIRYGQELVTHTAAYLGPKGTVATISNGMNCQNCHLIAGKKLFGNNFSAVASTYPKFRPRSGTLENIERRINDCIQRSLNGSRLEDGSRELMAIVAYITWVGKDVPKGVLPVGSGIVNLPFMDRAGDSEKGKKVYEGQCIRCHGKNGEGMKPLDGAEWKYPPLWGDASFTTGAGIFRLSRMAGYVKANMPESVTGDNALLGDDEAWDVAAYINSMPRPAKDLSGDWPDVATKPIDHPFGPYADNFSETHHKYGPYLPIQERYKGR